MTAREKERVRWELILRAGTEPGKEREARYEYSNPT